MNRSVLLFLIQNAKKNSLDDYTIRKIILLYCNDLISYAEANNSIDTLAKETVDIRVLYVNLLEYYKGKPFYSILNIIKNIKMLNDTRFENIINSNDLNEIDFIIQLYYYFQKECTKSKTDKKPLTMEKNFLNADIYATNILLDMSIPLHIRKDYFYLIEDSKLYSKNDLVKIIFNAYDTSGIDVARLKVKALSSPNIRGNRFCRQFIKKETSLDILKYALIVFNIESVRNDYDALKELLKMNDYSSKWNYLNALYNKYNMYPRNLKRVPKALKTSELIDRMKALIELYLTKEINIDTFKQELLRPEYNPINDFNFERANDELEELIIQMKTELKNSSLKRTRTKTD